MKASNIVVAVVAFLLGAGMSWYIAGSHPAAEPPVAEPAASTSAWYGGACEPTTHHLVMPTSEGDKALACGASVEEVISALGQPDQQHTFATPAGQRTLLIYFGPGEDEASTTPRAWVITANGKLLGAYALSKSAQDETAAQPAAAP